MRATIKFYNPEKGFGFARPDDHGQDIFVHVRQVIGGGILMEGDRIEYDIGSNPRNGKPQAVHIRVLQRDDGSDDPAATPKYGEAYYERENFGDE
jgi:cold shock protein